MHRFFVNDTATTEIYTLSLHDALPISVGALRGAALPRPDAGIARQPRLVREQARRVLRRYGQGDGQGVRGRGQGRSEEHTSELQSRQYLVCRLLLEKKKIR